MTFARHCLLTAVLLGACAESRTLPADATTPPPDAEIFCRDRETWTCERERAAGRSTDAEHAQCITDVVPMCNSALWEPGCAATAESTDACIAALSDASRLGTPSREIVECSGDVLCGRR